MNIYRVEIGMVSVEDNFDISAKTPQQAYDQAKSKLKPGQIVLSVKHNNYFVYDYMNGFYFQGDL